MKKELIIFAVLLWIFGLCLYSCGAKKSEKQKKEEITKQDFSGFFRNSDNSFETLDFESNLKINSVTTTDELTETVTTKKTYSPIDSKLPASYQDEKGNKKELNNSSYTEETKTEKNKRNSQNSQNSEKSEKAKAEKQADVHQSGEITGSGTSKKLDETSNINQEAWNLPFGGWLIIWFIIFAALAYVCKRLGWINYVTSFIAGLFQIRKK